MLTFYDLELDIIILKDLSYQILDMDELIEAFENRRITQSELNTVLMVLQKTVNSFNSRGVFKTLEDIYGQTSIQWLLEA
jgi:predicted RNA-binding protein associated with RNAse of E/G family